MCSEIKKSCADNIKKLINENISSTIKKICEHALNTYKTRENNTIDLNAQTQQFIDTEKNLLQFIENVKEQMTLSGVISHLKTFFNNMHAEIPQNLFITFSNSDEQLHVLKQEINIRPLEWIYAFDELISYVKESKEWYVLLDDIFTQLSKYEIQKNKSQFHINEFHSMKTGSDIFKKFEIIYAGELPINFHIIKNQMDEVKLRMLRNIFIYTLESDIKYINTDPGKIQIRGKYVKISDIPCDILSSTKKFIEIFALNTVFIDKDLNFEGKKQKLVIAAPEWHVINNRQIILNGENGQQQSKADNGLIQGENGKNGKPGVPGGAAGTIFGLGETFTNLKNLIIEANGGQGGDGQDGGNGVVGEDGKNPILPDNESFSYNFDPLNFSQLKLSGFRLINLTGAGDPCEALNFSREAFEMFGTDGQVGSNGGDGGYHGDGGPKGTINIIDLSIEPKRFNYDSVDGINGKQGIGGTGGLGGVNGKRTIISYNCKLYWWCARNKLEVVKEYPQGNQKSGANGADNYNTYGYRGPENSVQISNISNIIEEYKMYLEKYLNDSVKKNHLAKFIDNLNASIYVEIE